MFASASVAALPTLRQTPSDHFYRIEVTLTLPAVVVDNLAIGETAAWHLLEKGFPCFAFYGITDVEYSNLRREGFIATLESKGHPCEVLEVEPTYGERASHWHQQHLEVAEWVSGLNRPCGVFAISDYRARQVLEACRRLKFVIPNEIGIVGVDNMDVICEHSVPSLSSVARNDVLHGMHAAAMLDNLMKGSAPKHSLIKVPPREVVERGSTSCIIADPRLIRVCEMLNANLRQPFSIARVCKEANVSRRWVESEFRKLFDESPHQYVRRQRLSLARKLLVEEPHERIEDIASRTGFSSGKQLYTVFQKHFNQGPREYRQRMSLLPDDEIA